MLKFQEVFRWIIYVFSDSIYAGVWAFLTVFVFISCIDRSVCLCLFDCVCVCVCVWGGLCVCMCDHFSKCVTFNKHVCEFVLICLKAFVRFLSVPLYMCMYLNPCHFLYKCLWMCPCECIFLHVLFSSLLVCLCVCVVQWTMVQSSFISRASCLIPGTTGAEKCVCVSVCVCEALWSLWGHGGDQRRQQVSSSVGAAVF